MSIRGLVDLDDNKSSEGTNNEVVNGDEASIESDNNIIELEIGTGDNTAGSETSETGGTGGETGGTPGDGREKKKGPPSAYIGKYYNVKKSRNYRILELGELTDEKCIIEINKPQIFLICGKIGSGKSIHPGEQIVYKRKNIISKDSIEDLFNKYYNKKEIDFEILTLTKDNRIVWRKPGSFIRHRHDGVLIRVYTETGRSITTTTDHSFIIFDSEKKHKVVKGSSLKVGMKIPVARPVTFTEFAKKEYEVTEEKVSKIEEVEFSGYVYDFSVPGTETFVAGDGNIIVHNSYAMGVFIEEYLKNYPDVSLIVLDNMGIYFSLKFPNTIRKEIEGWGGEISPFGFTDYVEVLVPEGDKDKYPEGTYDGTISLKPNQIKLQTWLNLFRIDRTDAQGQILSMIMRDIIVRKGIRDFSIDDLIEVLNELEAEAIELKRREFHPASATAIRGKLKAIKTWGIFSNEKGLNIRDIAKKGKCVVIDLSKSDSGIGALLCSFLANKIYEERSKLASEASQIKLGLATERKTEYIPPIVLILEEAHKYIPASTTKYQYNIEALRTYIKQGRSPGLSLFLVTQEPGDLDVKALKQLRGILIGQLTTEDDFKKLNSISPIPIPDTYRNLIRSLGPGQMVLSLSGEQELKVIKVRPRHSINVARTENIIEDTIDKREVLAIPQINLDDLKKIKELKTIEKKIDELKTKNDELLTEKEELTKTVNELKLKIDTLTEINRRQKEEIEKLKKSQSSSPILCGVILGKYDESMGYIPIYTENSLEIDISNSLLVSMTKVGMGMKDSENIASYSINNFNGVVYCKKFIVNDNDKMNMYSIIVFSDAKNFSFDKDIIIEYSKRIEKNPYDTNIIKELYEKVLDESHRSEHNITDEVDKLNRLLDASKNRIEELEAENKALKERVTNLEKQNEILETMYNDYIKGQSDSGSKEQEETESVVMLKKTLEAKDFEIDTLSKTIVELNNKIVKYKELAKLQEEMIKQQKEEIEKLKTELERVEATSIRERTDRLIEESIGSEESETETVSGMGQEQETVPVPSTDSEILENEETTDSGRETAMTGEVRSGERALEVIDEIQLKNKIETFNEIFYNRRLKPIVKAMIKVIKSLDEICYVILSLAEAKPGYIHQEDIEAIMPEVSRNAINKHIKHLREKYGLLIKIRKGKKIYYQSNINNFVKSTIKKFIDINILTEDDIASMYYKVREALDLSVGIEDNTL